MNRNQRPSDYDHNHASSSDMQHALWQALVVTAFVTVVLKSLTGIIWFGAFLVAILVFTVSLGWILRMKRGMRR